MAIIIEKAKAEDAEAILKLTKVFGSETDNLSFGESGIPVSVENEASYIASIENSDTDFFFSGQRRERNCWYRQLHFLP